MHKDLDTYYVPIIGAVGGIAGTFDTMLGRMTAIISLGFVSIKFVAEVRKLLRKQKPLDIKDTHE